MKKVAGLVSSLLLVLSFLSVSDCASITQSTTQKIPVTSSPVGATVIVNGVRKGLTPLQVWLSRKKEGQVIRIESPGYHPVEIRTRRSFSIAHAFFDGLAGWMIGGIAALVAFAADDTVNGGTVCLNWTAAATGAFILIDLASGGGYNLSPSALVVTLSKADGPPRVDTILVDAEDFRNIKWIRVRRD